MESAESKPIDVEEVFVVLEFYRLIHKLGLNVFDFKPAVQVIDYDKGKSKSIRANQKAKHRR